MYASIEDNLQNQFNQRLQEDYLNVIRNSFSSCSNLENHSSWSPLSSQTNLNENTNYFNNLYNRRHTSYNIFNAASDSNGLNGPSNDLLSENFQANGSKKQQKNFGHDSGFFQSNNKFDSTSTISSLSFNCLDPNCTFKKNPISPDGLF